MNRYGAAYSTRGDLGDALGECVEGALDQIDGVEPTVAMLFSSTHHDERSLAECSSTSLRARHLIGCVGDTVVGNDREIESGPALALWVGVLPEASITSFRVDVTKSDSAFVFEGMPVITKTVESFRELDTSMLLLGDPFTFPVDHWLGAMNTEYPGLPVFGGLASGTRTPGQTRMFYGADLVEGGAVGLLIEGVPVQTIVSQGCRPIGKPVVITRAHENVIEEVAGKPPLALLQEVFREGSDEDKRLIEFAAQGGGLHIGQVVDEHISQPGRGDFLVRNVLGADDQTGSMMISDYARIGRTVCFHVRDAAAATQDLSELLATVPDGCAGGAILFSCNGRGTRFFEAADHDAGSIRTELGEIPVAGFFAAGEIGPVGGSNFLHGFTASIAVFS